MNAPQPSFLSSMPAGPMNTIPKTGDSTWKCVDPFSYTADLGLARLISTGLPDYLFFLASCFVRSWVALDLTSISSITFYSLEWKLVHALWNPKGELLMVMFLMKFALGAWYDHVWGSLDHSILSQFVDGIPIASRRWTLSILLGSSSPNGIFCLRMTMFSTPSHHVWVLRF